MGLNEFAGYLSVGVTAFLTGYIAAALRAAAGAVLSRHRLCGRWDWRSPILLVRDTRDHVRLEIGGHAATDATPIGFLADLRAAPRSATAICSPPRQAGLVNNLNDGMSWGIFPLFFAAFGLGVERIGILKAIYPGRVGRPADRDRARLSDRWGRKGLIVAGMWVQAGRVCS